MNVFKINAIILIIIVIQQISSKLLFVAEHFRHGSRGVTRNLDSLDRDYFFNTWDKKGEITPVGMRMQYLLGYYIKHKYANFIPKLFDPKQFYIMSSDYNRTIESLYCQLHGIFPPGLTENLTEEQKKQSIPPLMIEEENLKKIEDTLGDYSLPFQTQSFPLHIFDDSDNIFLLDEAEKCQRISEVKSSILNSNYFDSIISKFYRSYGSILEKHANRITKENLSDFRFIFHMCDQFMVDYIESRDLSFLEKLGVNVNDLFNSCKDISMTYLEKVYLGGAKNGEIALMSISRLMKKVIINFMLKRIDHALAGNPNYIGYDSPKFALISGHDNTVLATEMLLHKAFDSELIYPTYSSNLFFELHQKDDITIPRNYKDFYVTCIMNDKEILKVDFNDFKNKLDLVMWNDEQIQEFCQIDLEEENTYKPLTILFLLICLFLAFLFICILRRNVNRKNFKRIEEDEKKIDTL